METPPVNRTKLREYMYANRLTLDDMAEKINLTKAYISTILTGNRSAGASARYRIHAFLKSVYGKEYYRENAETYEQNSKPEVQNNVTTKVCVDVKPKQKLPEKIAHKTPPKAPQVAAKAPKAKRN